MNTKAVCPVRTGWNRATGKNCCAGSTLGSDRSGTLKRQLSRQVESTRFASNRPLFQLSSPAQTNCSFLKKTISYSDRTLEDLNTKMQKKEKIRRSQFLRYAQVWELNFHKCWKNRPDQTGSQIVPSTRGNCSFPCYLLLPSHKLPQQRLRQQQILIPSQPHKATLLSRSSTRSLF